jgi:hypothetical protein
MKVIQIGLIHKLTNPCMTMLWFEKFPIDVFSVHYYLLRAHDKIGVGVHGVNEFFKWYKEQDLTRGRSGRNVAARELPSTLINPTQ